MIQLPQRSVFRFFIPMIDVLTLLFCIYLLLPIVKAPEEDPQTEKLLKERDKLEAELKRLEGQLSKGAKLPPLTERLVVRVLEIDPTDGSLFYRNPDRVPITSEADARKLIANERARLGASSKELVFLILYPRDRRRTLFPTFAQEARYAEWFRDVAVKYDRPGGEESKDL